jgi:hypothetical protein
MQPFAKTIEQSNQAGVAFLLIEIDAGLTFLDVASTTSSSAVALRNRDNAYEAYVTILRYLDRVRLDDQDKAAFDERFGILRSRLADASYPV